MSLPLTIIGGYLGAGKTTLVNRLLRDSGKRLAVLVNEFGDLPIDADLIEAEGDDLIALAGGCVCCAYGDDLMEALIRLSAMDPAPDHIVLEASGVAMPGAIASTVGLLANIRVASVVVLADAERVATQLADEYLGDTIARQLRAADLIILTKTDLVEPAAARAALDTHVPTIPLSIGSPAPEVLLGTRERVERPQERHGAAHRTELRPMTEPEDADALAATLAADPRVVRAKGHLRDLAGKLVTLQVAGERAEVTPAPPGAAEGLVVITRP